MNYLSKPFDIQAPVERGNINFDVAILNNLQSKYDANKAIIDNTIAQYESLRGLTDLDNEYIAAQVSNIKNQVNKLGGLNLAHNTGRDTILNNLKNVMKDPIVTDILVSKANVDNYNTEVTKLKEKNPEKYNDANYQYGLKQGGYLDYLQGKVKKVGGMQYTAYNDLTEEHLKKLKTIKDLKGKRFIELPDPNNPGQKIRKEIDGLTNNEIQEYFGTIVSPDETNQMKINGWFKNKDNEGQARNNFGEYYTKIQNIYNDQLELASAKSKNPSLPQSERDDAEREVESLKTKIGQAKVAVLNKDKYNIDDVALELEKSSYLSGLSNIASTEWSVSTEKDDVYFAREGLKLDYEELALKKNKEARENIEFGLKMQKDYGVDKEGNKIVDEQTSVTTRQDVLPEDINGLQTLQEASTEQFNIVTSSTKELMSKIDINQKKQFIAELKKRGVDENLNKIGNGRVIITDAIQQAFDATNLGVYKNYADIINDASTKKDAIANDILKVSVDSYGKKFKEDPDKYVDKFLDLYSMASSVNFNSASGEFKKTWKRLTNEDFKDEIGLEIATGSILGNRQKYVEKLKSSLSKNPTAILAFTDSMEELQNQAKKSRIKNTIIFGNTLKEDAKQEVENTLKNYSSSGKITTFSVYDNINFLDKNTRENIINKIPQDRLEEGGYNFDPKGGLTARKIGDKIELLQFKGNDKDGVPKYAKASYDKGDFGLYEEVAKYVDIEADKRKGININEGTTFKKRNTRFNTGNEFDDFAEKKAPIAIIESYTNNRNILAPFGEVAPEYFSTPSLIKYNLKEGLKDKVDNNKLDSFIDSYVKNINDFSLQIIKEDNPASTNPDDKVFGYQIFDPNNKSMAKINLGLKNLDKDTRYLLEYQPQVYITNFLYSKIKNDPSYIDKIVKNN